MLLPPSIKKNYSEVCVCVSMHTSVCCVFCYMLCSCPSTCGGSCMSGPVWLYLWWELHEWACMAIFVVGAAWMGLYGSG